MRQDLIIGSMLGDGCVEKKLGRFRLKQKTGNTEYVLWCQQVLGPEAKVIYGSSSLHGKQFGYCQLYTLTSNEFRSLRKMWYDQDRQKIVPEFKLNESIFTHWFVQDGHNRHSHRYMLLNTQCFSDDVLQTLINRLEADMGIKSHKNNQQQIQIPAQEYDKVFELLRKNIIWDCFKYKVNSAAVKQLKSQHIKPNKLNMAAARVIRKEYDIGKTTYSQLAKIYGVTLQTIGNIINNVTYAEPDVKLGGCAAVNQFHVCKAAW